MPAEGFVKVSDRKSSTALSGDVDMSVPDFVAERTHFADGLLVLGSGYGREKKDPMSRMNRQELASSGKQDKGKGDPVSNENRNLKILREIADS
jgi:hypothetical protein